MNPAITVTWSGDVIQVLVPLLAALLALAWPVWQQVQRRWTFNRLVRAELLEAAPRPRVRGDRSHWTTHLTRRFMHEQLIGNPTGNTEFVLSLNPDLAYSLSQLWINFGKAQEHLDDDGGPPDEATNAYLADQWCWYLASTCRHLDGRWRSSRLAAKVWQPWHDLLNGYYPQAPESDGGHRHLPAGSDQPPAIPEPVRR
jgi:hypothetical protein